VALLVLAACAEPPAKGPAPPALVRPPGIATPDYWRDVKPILDRRCVVCHGCYDAPCQLNLSAYEGLARGAHKKRVYDTTRLRLAEPTRLFEDATTVAQWRGKGFYPVLSEPTTSGAPPGPGVLARMLALKRQHPLPATSPLPDSFDFALDRKQQCPAESEFDDFAARFPLWGMPYGLPGLSDDEQATLAAWLADGAPYREPPPRAPAYEAQVREWERFLNEGSPKHRLMSRYLYEHLYLADLYFDDLPAGPWFRLVRSRTAPGEPIAEATSVRPGDNSPGALREKTRDVVATLGQRLGGLGAAWEQVTAMGLYTVHDLFPVLRDEVLAQAGPAALNGITWYCGQPPVQGGAIEIDLRAIRHDVHLG